MICFCGFGLWFFFFFEILGKKMLVPLTASLYVPGTLDDADKVLVDIGTGYFVEVSWLQLAAFFFSGLASDWIVLTSLIGCLLVLLTENNE
jgi:hypothetical protein